MTLEVRKKKRGKTEKKTKWWKLQNEETCEEFRQKLRQVLGGQDELPEDWETTAKIIRETGRKVLGVSSGKRKDGKETWWWNEEVQECVQRKRLAKKKWDVERTEEGRQEYKEAQRRVKREVAKAKQKAYDELYDRLDTKEGEKDLYRLARQRDRDGKDVQQVRVIKDRDGKVLTTQESVQKRWKEYFEELMNVENDRERREEDVVVVEQEVAEIGKDEVRKALKRMKSGKAVGPDDVPVEVWKCLGETAVEFLTRLFNRILESEKMPEEWRRSVLTCMNDNGKSQTLEPTDRRMEVLSTKTKTRLGFWNVRTMYQTGKLAQVTSEMRRYNLHILGVSETRWIGSGKVITSTGETLLYSGREDSKHQEGKSLIEWKPVNSRLIKIRMRGRHTNMTIIQCYSPTNDSEEEAKDSFYEQLDTEVKLTPRYDVLIIMGDLNAKVGKDNSNNERAMGKLIDFYNTNNLVVGGTLFPHRDIHKLTWYSPNDRDKNQIDHMMINGMWRRSLIDVRVKRGADVGSDYQLVTAMIKLKLRKSQKMAHAPTKFNVQKLQDPWIRRSFVLQVKNRFQALQDLDTEVSVDMINSTYEHIKTGYQQSKEEICPPGDPCGSSVCHRGPPMPESRGLQEHGESKLPHRTIKHKSVKLMLRV
uniref:Endonuclease/exonuclease/phosphatase domain-containing protein n=1 Tax=Oryzias latipes TaxID=8090 RepID=A0A3B3ILM2_ORYLA